MSPASKLRKDAHLSIRVTHKNALNARLFCRNFLTKDFQCTAAPLRCESSLLNGRLPPNTESFSSLPPSLPKTPFPPSALYQRARRQEGEQVHHDRGNNGVSKFREERHDDDDDGGGGTRRLFRSLTITVLLFIFTICHHTVSPLSGVR